MAPPSKSWQDIADSKIDVDSPLNTELFTFLRDNIIHTDERVGIPVAPANRQANHRHRGLDVDGSDYIELTPQENLIAGGDSASGFTTTAIGATGKISFARFLAHVIERSDSTLDYKALHQAFVSANIVKKIKSSGGKGRFTCSMHMKRVAAASGVVGGTLRFGIWDGTAFVTGAYVDIDFDDVTTEYKRFYFVSNQIARPTALNLRAEWTADPSDWDTISNGDTVGHAGGYMANNGAGIAKWDISHRDGSGDDYDPDTSNLFYWWDEIITLQQETP